MIFYSAVELNTRCALHPYSYALISGTIHVVFSDYAFHTPYESMKFMEDK